jgi:hypothetical protein
VSAPLAAGAVCGRPGCGHGEDLHDGICFGTACECVRFVEPAGALPMPVLPEPLSPERDRLRAAFVEALDNAHHTHPCPEYGKPYWTGCVHYDETGRVSGVGSCHSERRADAVLVVRDAEVESLRARVAELEAQRERRRVRLVALQNDALSMRGSLSPMGEDRKVPFPLGETLTPAVDWLIGRVAELESRPSPADVLRQAADDLTAACPEHSDADEAWMDCPCEFADELRRKAALAGSGGGACPAADRPHQVGCPQDGVPSPSFAERADRETDPARRAAWRMLAQDVTDGEHYGLVHHDWRIGRDLPETGGV